MGKRFDSWAEVDLGAIQHNIHEISRYAGKPVIAIIKANAYGHGMIPVAKAALAAGCPFLAVARFSEALQLRLAGITAPVLVLGLISPSDVEQAAREKIRGTLFSWKQLQAYEAALAPLAYSGSKLPVHVKVDIGMGRLGLQAEEALPFLQRALQSPALDVEGLFSHFSKADMLEDSATDQQFSRFDQLVREADQNGIRPKFVHLANSAGAIFHSNICKYDLVRGGIAIYGLDPSDTAVLPEGFRPALSWKAGITSIKTVRAGQEISYCGRYQVKQDHARIGVAAVGYADGMCRRLGNFMMVHGKKVPVLGTVCMDQCMIDLNDVPQAQVGDEAVLIGFQEGSRISAEELGESWGTINYDVVCGIASRVQRIYQPETL